MIHSFTKKDIEADYEFGKKTLGNGKFGIVKKAKERVSGRKVAIKIINKSNLKKHALGLLSDEIENTLIREVNIMKMLNHPHIVKYLDFYDDVENFYIVMKKVKYGALLDYITQKLEKSKTLSLDDARKIFAQLLSAVEYCHGHLIGHRDLKLENILISNKNKLKIKLIDFGLANYIKIDELHRTNCGSLDYAAPEIIDDQPYNPIMIDIWSLGVILYSMIFGCFPWGSNVQYDIVNYNYNTNVISEMLLEVSHNQELLIDYVNLRDLLSKIFVPPNERFTLTEIKNHAWMKGSSISSYLPKTKPIKNVDFLLVDQMVALGFKAKDVMLALYENKNTQETAIYHLLYHRFYPESDKNENNNNENNNNKKQSISSRLPNSIVGNRQYSNSEQSLMNAKKSSSRLKDFDKRKNKSLGEINDLFNIKSKSN